VLSFCPYCIYSSGRWRSPSVIHVDAWSARPGMCRALPTHVGKPAVVPSFIWSSTPSCPHSLPLLSSRSHSPSPHRFFHSTSTAPVPPLTIVVHEPSRNHFVVKCANLDPFLELGEGPEPHRRCHRSSVSAGARGPDVSVRDPSSQEHRRVHRRSSLLADPPPRLVLPPISRQPDHALVFPSLCSEVEDGSHVRLGQSRGVFLQNVID
jgi:hypothetical protein